MTPVDIGDTQGTLQAQKTFETLPDTPRDTCMSLHSCCLFTKRLSPYSVIHKAAGLTVPSHSMILPGTTPINPEQSRWLEQVSEVVPTGECLASGFVNTAASYRSFLKKLPTGTIPRDCSQLTASGMEWWNDGIIPVKLSNGREP